MEANAVFIDPPASHAVLGVFARRFEVSSDLAVWSLVLVFAGLGLGVGRDEKREL